MGIYQLLSPVISISFSLTAAGFQTAVSKLTAEMAAGSLNTRASKNKKPFWAAICISLPLSFLCTFVAFTFAEPIGTYLLHEKRTIPFIRIISFSFPFVCIHACINGWFYGMKKAGYPSLAQIVEQLTRVTCVYFITAKDIACHKEPNIGTAVFGLAVGELVSMSLAIITFLPFFHKKQETTGTKHIVASQHATRASNVIADQSNLSTFSAHVFSARNRLVRALLATVLPLTANRLILTVLGSAESVAIPNMLQLHGYNTQTALSAYGVLTGMALPLVYFPNALTGSIAVMLLPMISENYCLRKIDTVRRLTLQTIKYSIVMGFCCMLFFIMFGPTLGIRMFHSPLAGHCIRTLGWICPFLYLDTTLSGILQGLGKSGAIFTINILSLLIRLAFVYFAIPRFGITGYLWGMLAGQLILTALFLLCLANFFQKSLKL